MIRTNLSIVFALAPARVGGLESVVSSLASGLAERGHDVLAATVVEPDDAGHEFVDSLSRSGVEVARVAVPHRSYHREILRLREIFSRRSPQVVHTHGYRGDVVAGGVARWKDVPVASTVHGFTGGELRNRFYEWLQRASLRRHDAVVAVSEPIRRRLARAGVPEDRLHLVRNAWSPADSLLGRDAARARLGLPEDGVVVGWVGRLSREKGPDVFLDAVDRLHRRGLEVTASVVGTGSRREATAARARRGSLDGRVRLHGRVPGAARVYRAFDVFVLSSRTEGTPVSLLEAMAAEVPIVATRVGGVPDVVRDGEEALLVPAEDPDALAEAVRSVLDDPDAAGRRAACARRRLETDFAVEPWLDRYEEIYRGLVGRP